ncbi:MAG: TetR family transcriptional regulator [Sphingomonadales bacterium]|nr:TetR family transcriptional regulator [Sphingomonadales bacterium]
MRIIEAAYHLLDRHGLEGLTIRAVLAETGLARRAFYDNFTGKDDLVLAVFAQTIRAAAHHYREIGRACADPVARIRMVVSSIALGAANIDEPEAAAGSPERFHRSAALSREHLRLAEARPRELQAALAPLIEMLADLLREAIAAGQVRECDPVLQATLIYNLLSTTVHTELLTEEAGTPDPVSRRRLAENIWEFCRRAIAV